MLIQNKPVVGKALVMLCIALAAVGLGRRFKQRRLHAQGRHRMETVVEQETAPGDYEADAWDVACIDDRFTGVVNQFEGAEGWAHVDRVRLAGGAKGLARHNPTDKTSVGHDLLEQIRVSIRLHKTKQIILTIHEGCGAYTDMPKDRDRAMEFIANELRRAREIVLKNGLGHRVRIFVVAFDGVHEVDPLPDPEEV